MHRTYDAAQRPIEHLLASGELAIEKAQAFDLLHLHSPSALSISAMLHLGLNVFADISKVILPRDLLDDGPQHHKTRIAVLEVFPRLIRITLRKRQLDDLQLLPPGA